MTKDQFKNGISVICWDATRKNPVKTLITSEIEVVGGIEKCNVNGIEEKVPISQLDTITPGSLLAASLKGLKNGQEDFRKESQKFFSDRGVNAIFEK